MLSALILAIAILGFGVLSFTPAIRRSDEWSATVTPLASIMGSGFLVCAPLLASVAGNYAPLVMAALLGLSWTIGAAIRFNIRCDGDAIDAPSDDDSGTKAHRLDRSHRSAARIARHWIESIGHAILTVAYVISVTYYIQLLAQFSLHQFGYDSQLTARVFATVVLATIALTGFAFGLKVIEYIERYAINLNLSMIAALIFGLIVHNLGMWQSGDWQLPDLPGESDHWHAVRIGLGLLIVVQGFETSRFLGTEHAAEQRVRTMKYAQAISSVVYLVFLSLMLVVMTPQQASPDAGVTAIVTLAGAVAAVLPMMVTVAAVGSQFSAAVADEAGCGGLLSQSIGRVLPYRAPYLLIGAATITLCWMVDVMQVIAIASRAFALFYAIECITAVLNAYRVERGTKRMARCLVFGVLALICVLILIFGISAEAGSN